MIKIGCLALANKLELDSTKAEIKQLVIAQQDSMLNH
jgi:hypothetical protein